MIMVCMYVCIYLPSLKISKIYKAIYLVKYNWKNKILINPNRKIYRSQVAGINLIKIHYALISLRVPIETFIIIIIVIIMTVMVAIIITIMLATIITIMLNDNKDWKSNNSNSNNDIFMISLSLMVTLHFSPEKKGS